MSSGLQIWDGNGRLIFDETSPVVKFLGVLSIGRDYTGEAGSGTIDDGRFTAYPGHTAFSARIDGGFNSDYLDARVSVSGNTLTWSYPQPAQYVNGYLYTRPNQTLIYGIY